MKNHLRKSIALILSALFVLAALPVFAGVSADVYNDHDVEKLRAFFEQESVSHSKNGIRANGAAYDPDNPATWTSCTWNSDGTLQKIVISNGGSFVSGPLDLSGCTGLKQISVTDCYISGLDVSGCGNLLILNMTGNKLTSVSVPDSPQLQTLWFKKNLVTEFEFTNVPLVVSFDCSENQLTEIDLSEVPLLTLLNAGDNRLESIDVSVTPNLTELNVKNNRLTSLDISALTSLRKLYSFGNCLPVLDLTVLNSGASCVLTAGNSAGFVGTKNYYSGIRAFANVADEGCRFDGWYENGELLSTDAELRNVLNGAERQITAKFTRFGDISGNGVIDVIDALMGLRYLLNLTDITPEQLERADYDRDGDFDMTDVITVMRIAVGLL